MTSVQLKKKKSCCLLKLSIYMVHAKKMLGYFFLTQMLGSACWVILLGHFNAGLFFSS